VKRYPNNFVCLALLDPNMRTFNVLPLHRHHIVRGVEQKEKAKPHARCCRRAEFFDNFN
jgi:hypothetical protein